MTAAAVVLRNRLPLDGLARLARELSRRPAALASLAFILVIAVTALLAPQIVPHDPSRIDADHVFSGPSWQHLLGTDYVGRDLFSRVIFGARTALEIALPAVVIGFFPGVLIGVLGGYRGGVIDKMFMVFLDTLLAFPIAVLAIVAVILVGQSKLNTILLIALSLIPGYARLARAQTLAAKENAYVRVERSLGASRTRIIFSHIFPNIAPTLLVLMAMDIPQAIATEAGLAFLGLGVQPPTADWGVMLRDGFSYVRTTSWPLIGPLVSLALVTAAFTLLGEALRDIADPRLAGAGTRRRRGVRLQRPTRL